MCVQFWTVKIDGEPWFVAKDVCDVLGIRAGGTTQAVQKAQLDASELSLFKTGNSRGRSSVIVSESGLYALIMHSRKPEAKAFRLPSRQISLVLLCMRPTDREQARTQIGILDALAKHRKVEIATYQPKAPCHHRSDHNIAPNGVMLFKPFSDEIRDRQEHNDNHENKNSEFRSCIHMPVCVL
jgi:hypothetical protein